MTHTPIITTESASCSCRKMLAIFRGNEPIGKFTLAAADCHRMHVEAAREMESAQCGLFDQQIEMFA